MKAKMIKKLLIGVLECLIIVAVVDTSSFAASPFQQAAGKVDRTVPFFYQVYWGSNSDFIPSSFVTDQVPGMIFLGSNQDSISLAGHTYYGIKYGFYDGQLTMIMIGVSDYKDILDHLYATFGTASQNGSSLVWKSRRTLIEYPTNDPGSTPIGLIMYDEELSSEWLESQK